MKVEVTPAEFVNVDFSADVIADIVNEVGTGLGVADDVSIRVDVDEGTPLGNSALESMDPIVISVESGALEDAKRPRQLSTVGTAIVLGMLVARVRDRLDPAFGDAPEDADLTPAHQTAWEVYSAGRVLRLGYVNYDDRQRRLYHYRLRHGFSDVGDEAFEVLWTSDGLTWAQITELSDRSKAAIPA